MKAKNLALVVGALFMASTLGGCITSNKYNVRKEYTTPSGEKREARYKKGVTYSTDHKPYSPSSTHWFYWDKAKKD